MTLTQLLKSIFARREPGVAIHRVVRHVAGCIGEADGSFSEEGRFPKARAAIRQAAMDGSLVIRGRKQMLEGWSAMVFSEGASRIPREYWNTHELNTLATDDSNNARASAHTALKPALRRPSGNNYSDLEADWNEVLALWPVAYTLEKPQGIGSA